MIFPSWAPLALTRVSWQLQRIQTSSFLYVWKHFSKKEDINKMFIQRSKWTIIKGNDVNLYWHNWLKKGRLEKQNAVCLRKTAHTVVFYVSAYPRKGKGGRHIHIRVCRLLALNCGIWSDFYFFFVLFDFFLHILRITFTISKIVKHFNLGKKRYIYITSFLNETDRK